MAAPVSEALMVSTSLRMVRVLTPMTRAMSLPFIQPPLSRRSSMIFSCLAFISATSFVHSV